MKIQRLALLTVAMLSICHPVNAEQKPKQMMRIGDEMVSMAAGRSFNEAQALLSNKQFAQAEAILKSLVGTEPNIATIRYKYAFVLVQQDKNDEAIAQAKKCVELKPSFFGGWALLGEASMNLNQGDEARKAYQQALSLQPTGENADIIREHLSELDAPKEEPVVVAPDPKIDEQNRVNMKFNQALGLCESAAKHFAAKEFDQGLQDSNDAVKLAPDSVPIKEKLVAYLNNYAAACVEKQQLDKAESLMKQAIQSQSGIPANLQITTLKNYQRLLSFKGRNDEAAKLESQIKSLTK